MNQINPIFLFLLDDNFKNEKTLGYMDWLITNLPHTEFKGINKYLYLLTEYISNLQTEFTNESRYAFLENQLKVFIAKYQEYTDGTSGFNFNDPVDLQRAFSIIFNEVEEALDILALENKDKDFLMVITEFFEKQRKEKLTDILTKSMNIATIGLGNKFGSSEAMEYAEASLYQASQMYSEKRLNELIGNTGNTKRRPKLVSSFGIPSIDEDLSGGLYECKLTSIEAVSGLGKTRFTLGLPVYSALLMGKSVLYVSLEQTQIEIESMLLARHIYEMQEIMIDSTSIETDNLSEEERGYVEIARYDLFESEKYGKLHIIFDITLNNMSKTFSSLDTLHGPFDVFVIDHMYILPYMYEKEIGILDRAQITGMGYSVFKKYVKENFKVGIAVNQLNQLGEEKTAKGQSPGQNGGAGGREVYRHSDYNMILYQTEQMQTTSTIGIFLPKHRSAAGDISPLIRAYKAISHFVEIERSL